MMRRNRIPLLLLTALFFLLVDLLPAQTIHVSLQGKAVEGKPLFWNDQMVAMMSRDGQLVTFAPQQAQDFRQVAPDFRSHSQATLRGELLREFGRSFDVSGTGQFLVVHPAGQRDLWADRFEQLYRSMLHYLGARGFPITRPEFPLVAIVYPSQQEYLENARRTDSAITGSTLGYYDPVTNRISMYDVTARSGDASQWYVNAETIIHEAAHQTAFNVGVHTRLADDPSWVVEGLGTMFEARGVWDSRHYPQLNDRINAAQLDIYRKIRQQADTLQLLQQQLTSDRLFAHTPTVAYAHAWALTFYLTEREPRKYAEYLQRLKRRGPFKEYPQADRLQDFVAVFGNDLRMFDARLQRFMGEL